MLSKTKHLLISQQKNGLQRSSLLDPEYYSEGEASGSGFYIYTLNREVYGMGAFLLAGSEVISWIINPIFNNKAPTHLNQSFVIKIIWNFLLNFCCSNWHITFWCRNSTFHVFTINFCLNAYIFIINI